jgi:acyl carrier protein
MQREEIIKICNEILAKEFELEESQFTPEADFASLGLDSLDAVDMVVVLEQQFKVDIRSNYKVGDFGNLEGLYTFIEKLVKQKNGA